MVKRRKGRKKGFKAVLRGNGWELDVTGVVEDFIESIFGAKEQTPPQRKNKVVYKERDGTTVVDLRDLKNLGRVGSGSKRKKKKEEKEEESG